jgi:hypothetical protein
MGLKEGEKRKKNMKSISPKYKGNEKNAKNYFAMD